MRNEKILEYKEIYCERIEFNFQLFKKVLFLLWNLVSTRLFSLIINILNVNCYEINIQLILNYIKIDSLIIKMHLISKLIMME